MKTAKIAIRDLSVGDLARRSGVPVSTIHFYEAKGLIDGFRNSGNHRRYAPAMLRRVAIIRVAQRSGVPLAEIKKTLSVLPAGQAPTLRDWKKMSTLWKSMLQKRIEMLTQLRDQLNSCIGCGCLSLAECPLRNPDDIVGATHTGAAFLDAAD